MRKRGKKVVKENNERWLITYSDLITLLMIFFVIMYAMSKVDVAKFMTLSQSLNSALNPSNQIQLNNLGRTALLAEENPSSGNQKGLSKKANAKVQNIQLKAVVQENHLLSNVSKQLQNYVKRHGLASSVSVSNQERGIQITLHNVVFFQNGQDTLTNEALLLLDGVTPFLRTLPNDISVEGYTDNVPIHTAQFPSNWELSVGRAVTVVEFLANQGVDPARLSATGYSKYRPLVPNDSSNNRQQNRRVNIVILRSFVSSALTAPASTTVQTAQYGGSAFVNINAPLKFNTNDLLTQQTQNSQVPNSLFGSTKAGSSSTLKKATTGLGSSNQSAKNNATPGSSSGH